MFVSSKAPRLWALVALAAVMSLCLASAATAEFIDDLSSTLTGSEHPDTSLGSLSLYSLVTRDAGIYTYSYTMTWDVSANGNTVTRVFAVENFEDMPYLYPAWNSWNFINPSYIPGTWEVKWYGGTLGVGQTVEFQYQSIYSPVEIPVGAYAVDDGDSAEGVALGQGGVIPEPSSLAGIALALVGVAPRLLRRRRR